MPRFTHAHTRVRTHTRACMHTKTQTCACMHTKTHTDMCVHAHKNTHRHVCARTQKHTQTCACTHTKTHTDMCVHAHKNTHRHVRACTQKHTHTFLALLGDKQIKSPFTQKQWSWVKKKMIQGRIFFLPHCDRVACSPFCRQARLPPWHSSGWCLKQPPLYQYHWFTSTHTVSMSDPPPPPPFFFWNGENLSDTAVVLFLNGKNLSDTAVVLFLKWREPFRHCSCTVFEMESTFQTLQSYCFWNGENLSDAAVILFLNGENISEAALTSFDFFDIVAGEPACFAIERAFPPAPVQYLGDCHNVPFRETQLQHTTIKNINIDKEQNLVWRDYCKCIQAHTHTLICAHTRTQKHSQVYWLTQLDSHTISTDNRDLRPRKTAVLNRKHAMSIVLEKEM